MRTKFFNLKIKFPVTLVFIFYFFKKTRKGVKYLSKVKKYTLTILYLMKI